ncbi:hypothetical protein D9M72_512050 [compost metagenome]
MRVLAVAHLFLEHAADHPVARHRRIERLGEPVGDGCIVSRGAGIGLGRHLLAEGIGRLAGSKLFQKNRIVGRIGDDRHIGMVLGRGADHCRAADVDVFDCGRIVAALGADFFEGIEVDDRKVDRGDAVRRHRGDVIGIVADREQAAVHARMQRLHAAIHDFRKAGQFGNVAHRQAGLRERLVRAAGRYEPDALFMKSARQIDDACFIGHGEEGGADRNLVRGGDFLRGDSHHHAPLAAPDAREEAPAVGMAAR